MDKHIATLEELELIESVLKGYPASMARGDAIRAVGSVRAAIALMRGQSDIVLVPRVPTDEMVWAGRDAWSLAHAAMKAGEMRSPMTETWAAMLAAVTFEDTADEQ